MRGFPSHLPSKIVHLHWSYIYGVHQVAQILADLSGLSSDFAKHLNVLMNETGQKMGGFLPTKMLKISKISLQPTNITDTKP